MNVKTLWRSARSFVDKNLPTILSGIALVGLGTSVALAIKETPKAQEAIVAAKVEKVEKMEGDNIPLVSEVKLNAWEGFKAVAPIYWPLATSTVLTSVCIIAADRTHNKRYLAVAAALSLKDKDFKEYKDKVKELFGEKKEEKVQNELAKDHAMNAPQDDGTVILTTHGLDLFHEPRTNTYFRSSPIEVEKGILKFYSIIKNYDGEGSIADLFAQLDVEEPDDFISSKWAWIVDENGANFPRIDINYSGSVMRTGEVFHELRYSPEPKWIG